jgi:hypothetical protein
MAEPPIDTVGIEKPLLWDVTTAGCRRQYVKILKLSCHRWAEWDPAKKLASFGSLTRFRALGGELFEQRRGFSHITKSRNLSRDRTCSVW